MISAGLMAAGFSAWKYSDDSLWMKIASGPNLQDPLHGQHIGLHDVLERRDEGLIAAQLLVPPAIGGRELGADEHLVDRRVELNPGKAAREVFRVSREKLRKIGVLEVADPVGHAEMAEVDDRNDVAAA